VNFKVCGALPLILSYQQRKKFLSSAKYYVWEDPRLCKLCEDGFYRRNLLISQVHSVLHHCHALTYGGNFGLDKTTAEVHQAGFYWPILFKDARRLVMSCDRCQRTGNIFKTYEMPQSWILEVELFDVRGIDFMGPFPCSNNTLCILIVVDYVSKWVEVIATLNNDSKVAIKFLKKNIFTRFIMQLTFATCHLSRY